MPAAPSSYRAYRSYRLLMWWTTLTFLATWLPLMRSIMDGSSYEWGTTFFTWHFEGRGLDGDYWFLVIKAVAGVCLLYAGWRRPGWRTAAVLAIWQVVLAADTLVLAISDPRGFRFRGDTLGVDISLTWIAPTLATIFAVIALVWTRRFRQQPVEGRQPAPVTQQPDPRLAIALVMIAIQWPLLHYGHGDWRDITGVVLTIAQWFLVSASFRAASPVAVR